MAFSILSMGPVIFGSTEALIAYLQGKHLLATNKSCPTCGASMTLQRRSDIEDKFRYIDLYVRHRNTQNVIETI